MPSDVRSAIRCLLTGWISAVLLFTGCSSKAVPTGPAPVGPASAARAPTPVATPAGSVRQLGGHPAAACVDPATSALVVLSGAGAGDPDTLTVFSVDPAPARVITLPSPATGLVCDGPGRALAPTGGGYFGVDLRAGTAERIDVDGAAETDFTAIARRGDGRLVLGDADGSVFVLGSATAVAHRDKLFSRVDSIVTQQNTAVVLDRAQTSVTAVGIDGKPRQALRAGEGATTMVTDGAGRVLVADTRGGELLVFGVDPLILRQRFPVHGSPYGLAGSQRLAWVSQTATNTVIGYDLATGIPVEKVRYPTVQQPNILSYDHAAGTLYVVSGSGGGVQVIEHAGPPQ